MSCPWRKGWASARGCFRAAETWMRGKQCSKSYLETAVDNLAALAFYQRHDYFPLKTLPRYYSNGVDAFVLQKDLLSSA